MAWLKRNLFTVIGAVVALVLLGLAGFFLKGKMADNAAAKEQLDMQTANLRQLTQRDPHPNEENIQAAKEAMEKLNAFAAEVVTEFPPAPVPETISNREFGVLLDTTISDLQQKAEKGGVRLPENYWFTFSGQKQATQFDDLQSLAARLSEVDILCTTLFDAKINELVSLKRAPTPSEKAESSFGTADYLDATAVTNDWAVIAPYQVTFNSFTAELAKVLEGLMNSDLAFVVKNVVADPAPEEDTLSTQPMPMRRPPQSGPYRGYQTEPRYNPGQPTFAPPTRSSNTLLDEKLLQFTLTVEAIQRKKESTNAPPAGAQAPMMGTY